jgi:hypothetical protein
VEGWKMKMKTKTKTKMVWERGAAAPAASTAAG